MSRITTNNNIVRNRMCYNTTGCNQNVITNSDSWQYQGISSNIYIIANFYLSKAIKSPDQLFGQPLHPHE